MARSFWEWICSMPLVGGNAFVISTSLLLISVFTYFVVEPGTPTHSVIVFNLIILTAFACLSGTFFYLCRRNLDEDERPPTGR